MRRSRLALTLSTFCFLASSCASDPSVVPLNVKAENPDRFICERVDASERPALPPGHEIDWSTIRTVEQARREHEAYVASIRDRNGIVAGYIVRLEGVNFTCWNNMQWQRDYYDRLPPPPNP